MGERKKLGDLLKEAGLIDEFQLQSALSHQRNWGGKLGAILIEMRFVKEEDVARVIAESLRIPYVNLFEPEVPEAVYRLIKPDLAKKYHVMPARKEGGALVVAMADPLDMQALDEIRFITGLVIKPALAMQSEIEDAIRKYYEGAPITQRMRTTLHKTFAAAPDKMEIIRESEMKGGAEWQPPAPAPAPPKEEGPKQETAKRETARQEAPKQETVPDRLVIDALLSLLVEKNLITREELIRMIEQKKMGL